MPAWSPGRKAPRVVVEPPKGRVIFAVLSELADHPDVLFTKLLGGRTTLVHRRLGRPFGGRHGAGPVAAWLPVARREPRSPRSGPRRTSGPGDRRRRPRARVATARRRPPGPHRKGPTRDRAPGLARVGVRGEAPPGSLRRGGARDARARGSPNRRGDRGAPLECDCRPRFATPPRRAAPPGRLAAAFLSGAEGATGTGRRTSGAVSRENSDSFRARTTPSLPPPPVSGDVEAVGPGPGRS